MVTVLELIDQLDALGVDIGVVHADDALRLTTRAKPGTITDELGAAIRQHRDMLVNVVIGRRTGHAPAPCSTCGEVSFTPILAADGKKRTTWPTCRLTHGCDGRHQPRDIDTARTFPRPPPKQARPPASRSKQRYVTSPAATEGTP